MAKTRHTRPQKRSIRIHRMPSGARVHTRFGTSLKAALDSFFKEFLKERGYTDKKVVGNVMICRDKEGAEIEFRAYEVNGSA